MPLHSSLATFLWPELNISTSPCVSTPSGSRPGGSRTLPNGFVPGSRTTTDPATLRLIRLSGRQARDPGDLEVARMVCVLALLSAFARSIQQVASPDPLKRRELIVPPGHDLLNRATGKHPVVSSPIAKQAEQTVGLPVVGIHHP